MKYPIMKNLQTSLIAIQEEAEKSLKNIASLEECNHFRIKFFGKKGLIPDLNSMLKDASIEEKRVYGPLIQSFRTSIEQTLNKKISDFNSMNESALYEEKRFFDVSLVQEPAYTGSVHLLTLATTVLEEIFLSMGFSIVAGKEVETDFYNFTALNIAPDHPARDAHDTFWISDFPHLLLRTHTSNAQIHAMETQSPPLAIASTGRVFRNEATDSSHDFMFMQVEALLVDKGISIAHLLYIAQKMLRLFFETEHLQIRVRPGYFPFVEPGLEIDASCPFCTQGCSVCKGTRWIELGGAGLVHPNVLHMCNINPDVYSGCALGFGISRLALLKYNISDVRLLYNQKIEFLAQCNRLKF